MNTTSAQAEQNVGPKAVIVGGFASLTLTDQAMAAAGAAHLALNKCPFEYSTSGAEHHLRVSADRIDLLDDLVRPHYAYVQQGGSSCELYLHVHESEDAAMQGRYSCWEKGAYNTSAVVTIPPVLAALGNELYSVVDSILSESTQVTAAERPALDHDMNNTLEEPTPAANTKPRM